MAKALLSLVFLILAGISSQAFAELYVVAKGDTLSTIARKSIPGPLYGTNGSLEQILKLNPHIKNPDFILPGNQILIQPASTVITENDREPQTETVVTAEPPPKNLYPRSALVLSPLLTYLTISSTDRLSGANARFSTELSFGLDFQWQQEWSEAMATFQELKWQTWTFMVPATSTPIDLQKNAVTTGAFLGVNFSRTSKIFYKTFVGFEQELFSRATAVNTYVFDRALIPRAGVGAGINLLNLDPFRMTGELTYAHLFNASSDAFQVEAGREVLATLNLLQELSFGHLGWGLSYGMHDQSSQYVTQSQRELQILISLSGKL